MKNFIKSGVLAAGLILVALISYNTASAQCSTSFAFGTVSLTGGNTPVTISTCNFDGDYSTVNGATAGANYTITYSNPNGMVTVRSGSFSGPVIAFGNTPFTFTNTFTGTIFLNWTSVGCGMGFASCATTTITCNSCTGGFNPCTAISAANACGVNNTTVIAAGAGAWAFGPFSPPGQEKIYTFTPSVSGNYTVTQSTNTTGTWVDYFFKPQSSGCNNTGWTFAQDLFGAPVTGASMSMTAGTPYYILLDPENTSGGTVTFMLNCPASGGCANTSQFGSATIPTNNSVVTISTCIFAGEYAPIFSAISGTTLRFTSSVTTDWITIRSGSPTGPVIAQGTQPLQFVNTFTGTLYAHYNTNSSCGTQSGCRTATVQCVSCAAAPVANDLICNATLITGCSATPIGVTGTTINANTTSEVVLPACGNNAAADVWYRWTGVTTGFQITLNTCTSLSYDTWISVYSSSNNLCSGVLTCIASNDDFCGLGSQVQFIAPTTTLFIRVHGFSTAQGNFTLTRSCVSAFNPCAQTIPTVTCGSTQATTWVGGTGAWSGTMGSPFGTPGEEKLFIFTPSSTSTYFYSQVSGGGPTSWIDVFYKPVSAGCSNTGWTFTDDVFYTENGTITTAEMNMTGGVSYYILLDPETTAGGTRTWSVTCPGPMTITSMAVTQVTGGVAPGSDNQAVLRLAINTNGQGSPININSMVMNIGGSSNATDIENVKVYYTGLTSTFNPAAPGILFDDWANPPMGNLTLGGSQNLTGAIGAATNNFWITYDISSAIPACPAPGVVDGQLVSVNGTYSSPTDFNGNPAGNRPIIGATNLSPTDLSVDACLNPTLSWTAAPGYTGAYDVYFDGGATGGDQNFLQYWSPVQVTGTSVNVTTLGLLAPNTTYMFYVVVSGQDASGCIGYTVTTGSNLCFATPPPSICNDNDDIRNFTLNGVSNTTTAAQANNPVCVNYYPTPCIPFPLCTPVPFSVNSSGIWSEGYKIWIDLNNNGSFEDLGELVASSPGTSTAPFTGTITLPLGTILGSHRLRVRSAFATTSFTSISQTTFGETEDYNVCIYEPPVTNPVAGTATATASSVCNNQPTVFCANGSTGLVQWQFATTCAGPWTNIAGATNACQTLYGTGAGTISVRAQVTGLGCGALPPVFTNCLNLTIIGTAAFNTPCNVSCGSNVVTCGQSVAYTTVGTNADPGEVSPPATGCNTNTGWCNAGASNSAWFTWTAPAGSNGGVTITVQSGGTSGLPQFDSQVALWNPGVSGTCSSYTGWTLVAANDDNAAGGWAFASQITVPACTLIPGRTYFIQVDGFGTAVGAFRFNITCPSGAAPTFAINAGPAICNDGGVCGASLSSVTGGGALNTPTTLTSQCGSTVTYSNNAPAFFPVGSTTVTWTGTDAYGSSSTATQNVVVSDCELPVITFGGSSTVTVNSEDDNSPNGVGGSATANDNCDGSIPTSYSDASTQDPDPNNCGHYTYVITRTWSATDGAGNTGSSNQTINVQDVTAPVFTSVPADIFMCFEGNTGGCSVSLGMPTATDAAGSPISFSNDAPACFAVGTTVVTWTATDVCGNSSTATQNVTRNPELTASIAAVPVIDWILTCAFNNSANIILGLENADMGNVPTTVVLEGSANGGTPGYTYQWSGANGITAYLSDATAANPTFTPPANHPACATYTYTLSVTDANGCSNTNGPVTVVVSVVNAGVDENGAACGTAGSKVLVCHIPPGNPGNYHNICVSTSALPAHTFGPMVGPPAATCGALLFPDCISTQHKLDCIGVCASGCSNNYREGQGATAELTSEELGSGMVIENFPDPFRDKTNIRFVMDSDTHVSVEVYDLSGKFVSSIYKGDVTANTEYRFEFSGTGLTNGMYIYKVVTPANVHTGKMLLIKE